MNQRFDELVRDAYLEALGDGRYIYLTAWGSSMYPFIKNYDILTIESAKDGYKIGDIVIVDVFSKEILKFVAHRIVNIKDENGRVSYFIKGDNYAGQTGSSIEIEKIKGRVKEIERRELLFNFNSSFMKRSNIFIAFFSYRVPRLLIAFKKVMDLLIEWPWIFRKIKRRLRKGKEPFLYNAEQLLLILARIHLNQGLIDKAIAIISEGLYWTRFLELTARQGVVMLVYNSLRVLKHHIRIPQFVFDKLKSTYLFIASETASQHRGLTRLLKMFDRNNIPIVPLKGTFLSQRLYGDIVARGLSVDFDLLVKEKDKDIAADFLEQLGYVQGRGEVVKDWQWNNTFGNIHLHWDITMMVRNKERIEGLWRGARLTTEGEISYYEFNEEELLLYLSAHLVNSADFGELKYLCDINELLHKYHGQLNWDRITKKAKSWRLSNSLYSMLMISKALLDSDVPFEVLRKLKPSFLKLIFIKVFVNQKVVLRNGIKGRLIDNLLSYIFFELIEAQSLKEYLYVFRRVFFPPREVLGKRNYIIRILKGIVKVLKRSLKNSKNYIRGL